MRMNVSEKQTDITEARIANKFTRIVALIVIIKTNIWQTPTFYNLLKYLTVQLKALGLLYDFEESAECIVYI